MRYFFHKLGLGNSDVVKYLGHAQVEHVAKIAIFFGESTVDDCLAGKQGLDARDFCVSADPKNQSNTRIVITAFREFWVLQPIGRVELGEHVIAHDGQPCFLKTMLVEVLVRKPLKEVPHLLASMGSNAYWSRGTFREIGKPAPLKNETAEWPGWQHQVAIELQLPEPRRRVRWPAPFPGHQLLFLSSVELETLVAKVFEEAGCFVPAYRGGMMADVDIIARNESELPVEVGFLRIMPGETLAIQVKSWMRKPERALPGVLLVSLNLHRDDRADHWNAEKLWFALGAAPHTTVWLHRSLAWLGTESLSI